MYQRRAELARQRTIMLVMLTSTGNAHSADSLDADTNL